MPNSYVEYTTSGTGTNGLGQRVFTAPTLFRHIDDIRAKGLSGSTWTELSISARGTTTVTLSAVPTGKSKVRIYRQTPADPLVDFTKGATLTAADLDSAYNQGLLLSQEVAEQADPSGGSGISGIDSAQLASNLSLGGTTTTNSINVNGTLNLHGNSSVKGERVGTLDTLALYSNDEVDLRIGNNSSSQAALKVEQVGAGTSAKVTAPLTTNANITSAGNKALITKEYADATYAPAPTTGEILEVVSSVCDGSTVNGYTFQNVTAIQDLSTTWGDINGSSISYTPPTGTTQVIYSFNYGQGFHYTHHNIASYIFIIDDFEVTYARSGFGANNAMSARTTFTWTINIGGTTNTNTGRLSSWSGAKTLKMQAREHHSNNQTFLHTTGGYWDGGTNTNAQFSMPTLTITAIA